jgi:ankyrin repeat protein
MLLRDYCEKGDLLNVKLLVENGADVTADDNIAVRWAGSEGHLDVVKYLVSVGADIKNGRNCWSKPTKRWDYILALEMACIGGHLEVVKYLVSIGACVTGEDNASVGDACQFGHLEVAKYLVSMGANVFTEDNFAMEKAIVYGHTEVVKYIKNLSAKDKYIKLLNKRFRVINKDLMTFT